MKKEIIGFAKTVQSNAEKYSPEILLGVGIAGFISTTVLAVKATPKAIQLIEDKKDELNVDKLTVKETIQTTWKCYLPTALTAVTSTACLIMSNNVKSKRTAALATMYKLSESTLANYKEKVIELYGEEGEKKVKEKIDKEKVDKAVKDNNDVYIVGDGDIWFLDDFTGRLFKSTRAKIQEAVNELNVRMINGNYISLNEFYYEIGLKGTSKGSDLGWNLYRDGLLHIDTDSAVVTEDGRPCVVLDYDIAPKYDFYKLT